MVIKNGLIVYWETIHVGVSGGNPNTCTLTVVNPPVYVWSFSESPTKSVVHGCSLQSEFIKSWNIV